MTALDGLQAAMRAEHAAIWGYGVAGAAVPPELRVGIRDVDTAHRASRDELAATIDRLGSAPVPAEASYELPFPVIDATSALQLCDRLEAGVAEGYAFAVASADTMRLRSLALAALEVAALRQLSWRRAGGADVLGPEFPGI